MAKQENRAIVVSIAGLPRRKQKKTIKRLTREVAEDRCYRKTLRRAEIPIPREVAKAAARAAVEASLGVKTGNPAVPPKKSGLEVYTELVDKFAKARRVYNKHKSKKLKAAIKQGYDPATGLWSLQKAEKIKKIKKIKPYKAKKKK